MAAVIVVQGGGSIFCGCMFICIHFLFTSLCIRFTISTNVLIRLNSEDVFISLYQSGSGLNVVL